MARVKYPSVSVVVCCFNGADVLPGTLKSLSRQNWKGKLEIIVVDDGSRDDTAKIAKSFKVRLIQNKQNLGLAASRNVGARAAKGDLVIYTDDDCRPQPSWVSRICAEYKDESVLAVGGKVTSKENDSYVRRYLRRANPLRPLENSLSKSTNIFYRLGLYLKGIVTAPKSSASDRRRPVYSLVGANMSFRKSTLESVGYFDERFRFGGEEEDIFRRINEGADDGVIYSPRPEVIHHFEPGLKDTLRRSMAYGKGNARMFYKYPGSYPVVYPIPVVILLSLILGFVHPLLLLSPLLLIPVFYTRWLIEGFKERNIEIASYAYVQFAQEWASNVGLIKGLFLFRDTFKRMTPPSLANKQTALLGSSILLFVLFGLIGGPLQLVYSLLFSLLIPGLLLAAVIRIQIPRLEAVAYVPLLSLALLFIDALLANGITVFSGPALELNSVVFTGVIATTTSLLLLLARNTKTLPIRIGMKRPTWKLTALVLGSIALPALGALAATTLNQTGRNGISMGVLAIIAAILILTLHRSGTTILHSLTGIYSAALTLLLMTSMRGDLLGGTDTAKEYFVYELTKENGHWLPSIFHDAYNACLSINLFPTLLSSITNLDGQSVFRVLIPMIFAFVPIVIYVLTRQFTKHRIAMLAAIFFIVQPAFMTWSSVPVRQMMAITFFVALLLAIFDSNLAKRTRYAVILLLGFAMIISHYSTTYIALAVLGVAFLIQLSIFLVRRYKLNEQAVFTPRPTVFALISLLLMSALWYGPINHTSGNITDRVTNSVVKISRGEWPNLFADSHSEQTGILDQVSLFSEPRDTESVWKDYLSQVDAKYAGAGIHPIEKKTDAETIAPRPAQLLPYAINPSVADGVLFIGSVIAKLARLFLVVGVIVLGYRLLTNKRRRNTEHISFVMAAAGILLAVIIIPHASIDYDVLRTTQQLLPLLALPTVLGAVTLLKLIPRLRQSLKVLYGLVSVFIVTYFLFASGLIPQLTGGSSPLMTLNNKGNQYDQLVAHTSDLSAGTWLHDTVPASSKVYSSYFGGSRLWLSGVERPMFYNDILPWTIDRDAYVFASYPEVTNGTVTTYVKGSFVTYNYPAKSLEEHKDLLYSNGNAKIYR